MWPDLQSLFLAAEQPWRSFVLWLPRLSVAALVLVLFLLFARAVRSLGERLAPPPSLEKAQLRRTIRMTGSLAASLLTILGAFAALTIVFPSVNGATIISTLGLGSVAIGFAFKDIFQNLLSGLLILLTRPFRVGDQIVIGTVEGTIEEIQIRATVIRTYDNRRIVMPNSNLFTNFVIVNTGFDQRRVTQNFVVPVGTDLGSLETKLVAALSEVTGLHESRVPDLRATSLQGGRVDLSLDYWVKSSQMNQIYLVNGAVLRTVNRVLVEEIGVEALEKLTRGGMR